jgi:hypothetical protein
LQRNAIARRLVKEVGIELLDLYEYVERFCNKGQLSQHGNYTKCAIQSSGLHFFTTAPQPSGQQYTGLAIANAAVRGIPVLKTHLFAPFHVIENDRFTKTDSGQTEGMHSKRYAFFCRHRRSPTTQIRRTTAVLLQITALMAA